MVDSEHLEKLASVLSYSLEEIEESGYAAGRSSSRSSSATTVFTLVFHSNLCEHRPERKNVWGARTSL